MEKFQYRVPPGKETAIPGQSYVQTREVTAVQRRMAHLQLQLLPFLGTEKYRAAQAIHMLDAVAEPAVIIYVDRGVIPFVSTDDDGQFTAGNTPFG